LVSREILSRFLQGAYRCEGDNIEGLSVLSRRLTAAGDAALDASRFC
jgi:hypothetical protein